MEEQPKKNTALGIIGLILMNIIALSIGISLASMFFQGEGSSSSQDNHFLGGIFSLIGLIIRIIISLIIVAFPIALVNLVYIIKKTRK